MRENSIEADLFAFCKSGPGFSLLEGQQSVFASATL